MTVQRPSPTIAFIGAGNMACSIIGGMLKSGWAPQQIVAAAPSAHTREAVQQQWGITVTADNAAAVTQADGVILCVKPPLVKPVLTALSPVLVQQAPLLISVAAGINLASLAHWGGATLAIIRSMPNTPAAIGYGASGLFANQAVAAEHKALAATIFQAIGIVEWVDQEALLDAVIAVSGSGPAYYFLFMEAMAAVGAELGLPPAMARRLTLQTALGAAKMAGQSDVDLAQLRQRVCSPGGTTEQAIHTLQAGKLPDLIEQAMIAAVRRATAMAVALNPIN